MSDDFEGVPTKPSATPMVLSRNVIPSLVEGLDASDLLEIYALVRSAPLHGIADSKLRIHKVGIGIRYRPKVSPTGQLVKEPLELTLEYGPQRLGPSLNNEATPYIQIEESASFIAWDNVGKVYYTTNIVKENFVSSYYMASMTGAVLEKILLQAVEYTERRRYYQPFAVYTLENGREIRSSSSADFTQFMWQHLANLGVEIEPILPPPLYEARIWATSVKKVIPEPAASHAAATFYQNLYQCLESIANNDYSEFAPSASPTVSPMPTSSPSLSFTPTELPTAITEMPTDATESQNETDSENLLNSDEENESEYDSDDTSFPTETPLEGTPTGNSSIDDDFESSVVVGTEKSNTKIPTHDPDGDSKDKGVHIRQRYRILDSLVGDKDSTENTIGSTSIDEGGDYSSEAGSDDTVDDLFSDFSFDSGAEEKNAVSDPDERTSSSLDEVSLPPEPLVTNDNDDSISSGQDVEKAKQAAQEAQVAADMAKNAAQTEEDAKAADAAQAAAHAAKAAADATSNAAAQAAMEGILSGDGSMMTSIINTCFTNPQYQIGSIGANGTLSAEAYLYRDGSRYYKLNMSKPFLEVVKVNRPMPKAVNQSSYGSGGDFVDWVLALGVLGMMFLAVLVILQQMGHVYVESIFKCQRWFFNPRKYDYEGEMGPRNGDGYSHQFGEDGIPLSMGGRIAQDSPIQPHRLGLSSSFHDHSIELPTLNRLERGSTSDGMGGLGDVELCRASSRHGSSGGSASGDSVELDEIPERLTRDPDLVDFPDLKSFSKVAMPVRANGNHTPISQYSEDDGDQSVGNLVPFD